MSALFYYPSTKQGVTLLEMLMGLAILATLAAIVGWSFFSVREGKTLNAEADIIVSVINEARTRSISSKNASPHGVHFEDDKTVLFEGSSFVSGAPSNEVHTLDESVHITTISLDSGGNEVVFDRLVGTTENFGSVVIESKNDATKQRTITIQKSGIVER